MEKYPWCNGIDIDLEKGNDYSTHEASTAMFKNIYNTVKAYDSSKMMNICLLGMTSVNGSVGGEGAATYSFTIDTAGTYDVAVRLCYPFWDKNGIYISIDGVTKHFTESRLWWPYWRTTFWTALAKGISLSAGTHTITISVDVKGVQFYGFRICSAFSEEPSAGEAVYTLAPRQFKDVNGNMVGPDRGFKLTLEMLRRKPDSALIWYEDLIWSSFFVTLTLKKINVMTSSSQMVSDTHLMNADADDYSIHIHNQWFHYLVPHRYQIYAV